MKVLVEVYLILIIITIWDTNSKSMDRDIHQLEVKYYKLLLAINANIASVV